MAHGERVSRQLWRHLLGLPRCGGLSDPRGTSGSLGSAMNTKRIFFLFDAGESNDEVACVCVGYIYPELQSVSPPYSGPVRIFKDVVLGGWIS